MVTVAANETLGMAPDGTYSNRYLDLVEGYLNSACADEGMIAGVSYDSERGPAFELVGYENCDLQRHVPEGQFHINSLFKASLARLKKTVRVDKKLTDTSALTDWENFVLDGYRNTVLPLVDEIGSLYVAEENLDAMQWLKDHADEYPNATWWAGHVMQDVAVLRHDPFNTTFPWYPDPWPGTSYYPYGFTNRDMPALRKESEGLEGDPHLDPHTVVRRAGEVQNKEGWQCGENYCSISFHQYPLYKERCLKIAQTHREMAKGDPEKGIVLPRRAQQMLNEAADSWESGDFPRLSQVFATGNMDLVKDGHRLVIFAQPVESYDLLAGIKFDTYGFTGMVTPRAEGLVDTVEVLMKSVPDMARMIDKASGEAYTAKKTPTAMSNIFVEYIEPASLLKTFFAGLPIGVNTDNYEGEGRVKLNLTMIDGVDRKFEIFTKPILEHAVGAKYHGLIDGDYMQYACMTHELTTNLGAGPNFVTPSGQKAGEVLGDYWGYLDEATSDAGNLQIFKVAYDRGDITLEMRNKAVLDWIGNRYRQIATAVRTEPHSRGSQVNWGNLLRHDGAIAFDENGVIIDIDFDCVCEVNEEMFLKLHKIRTNGQKEEAKALYYTSIKSFEEHWSKTEILLAELNFPEQFRQVYK